MPADNNQGVYGGSPNGKLPAKTGFVSSYTEGPASGPLRRRSEFERRPQDRGNAADG